MMRTLNFAKRNIKELLRDPMSIVFSVLLPLFFLIIFQQFKIPTAEYALENFTPGIIIFSFAFVSLFTAQLIARDRCSSLLARLFASPMKAIEYVVGYTISLIPLALLQCILFFTTAILLGLSFSINVVYTIIALMPISILFIGLGIMIGCLVSDNAAGPLSSLIVQLVTFTSGMWFPIETVGKVFGFICKILPFNRCLNVARSILNGLPINLFKEFAILLIYTIIIYVIVSVLFRRKMVSDKK